MIIPLVITSNLGIYVESLGVGLFQLPPEQRDWDHAPWKPDPGHFHAARSAPGCPEDAVISNFGQ